MDQKYKNIIVPSKWVENLYSRWIDPSKIYIWPVGIDTDKFFPGSEDKEIDFLIYFKRRSEFELSQVIDLISRMGKSYIVVRYGEYSEDEFINLVKKSKYGILINGSESQGIAVQEMLSCDLPLLVWDIKKWSDLGPEIECQATSIPYWDSRCGEKIYHISEMEESFSNLINKEYSPREFILENLDIREKTLEIINLLK